MLAITYWPTTAGYPELVPNVFQLLWSHEGTWSLDTDGYVL
jgi:hypothetical protein